MSSAESSPSPPPSSPRLPLELLAAIFEETYKPPSTYTFNISNYSSKLCLINHALPIARRLLYGRLTFDISVLKPRGEIGVGWPFHGPVPDTTVDSHADVIQPVLKARPDLAAFVRSISIKLDHVNWTTARWGCEEELLFAEVEGLLSLCPNTTALRLEVEPDQESLTAAFGERMGNLAVSEELEELDVPYDGAGSLRLASRMPLLRRLALREYCSAKDQLDIPTTFPFQLTSLEIEADLTLHAFHAVTSTSHHSLRHLSVHASPLVDDMSLLTPFRSLQSLTIDLGWIQEGAIAQLSLTLSQATTLRTLGLEYGHNLDLNLADLIPSSITTLRLTDSVTAKQLYQYIFWAIHFYLRVVSRQSWHEGEREELSEACTEAGLLLVTH